jgi:hypothetical protein
MKDLQVKNVHENQTLNGDFITNLMQQSIYLHAAKENQEKKY